MDVDKRSLKKLLQDAIPMLCKSTLPLSTSFCIEAMIGITVLDRDSHSASNTKEFLISFKQLVNDDGTCCQKAFGESDNDETVRKTPLAGVDRMPISRLKFEPAEAASPFKSGDVVSRPDSHAIPRASPVDIKHEPRSASIVHEDTITLDDDDDDDDDYGNDESHDVGGGVYGDNSIGSDYGGDVGYEEYGEGSQSYHAVKREVKPFHRTEHGQSETEHAAISSSSLENFQSHQLQMKPMKQSKFPRIIGRQQVSSRRPHPVKPAAGRNLLKSKRPSRQQFQDMASVGRKAPEHAEAAPAAMSMSEQRSMLRNLCSTIASQSIVCQQFICQMCNAQLSSRSSLMQHIKGSHLATGLISCDLCGETFKWPSQLQTHRRRFHRSE